ncbi:cellular tumor antigen p53 isoform X1 [Nematostella vectensis]|uniref:cellular tumor antigen p53 isoform X1 n=2 Tax=Nematostella vectensis TaxID=45351 RepID=UPI0020778852|nr:cellular tumor antigen p53 isoform X1 [Nematostella vectensis]
MAAHPAKWSIGESYSTQPVTEIFPDDIFQGDDRVKLEYSAVSSGGDLIDSSSPEHIIPHDAFQAGGDYSPAFPGIIDNDEYPLSPGSPSLPNSLRCSLMATSSLSPHHVIAPSSDEVPGEYSFKLTLETQPKKVANPDWIYSTSQNKLYIKPQTPCPMKFSVTGCVPPGTFIRAIPIFKLPEHAKDVVRCCPNHTLLEQSNRDHPAMAHFIRSDNPRAEYERCAQSGRLSVKIPFHVTQGSISEEIIVHELFSFVCNNSCGGLNRRAIQIVFTLETGGGCELLGRCSIETRVCACPGRDSKQDNEAVSRPGRKKRKISGDVSSSTCVSPFSNNELSPSPSRGAEDNTVYNLKVCGYVNYLILRKIAFALEFFANMRSKISDIPSEACDMPEFFELSDQPHFSFYNNGESSTPVPRPIPQSSSIPNGQQQNEDLSSSTAPPWYQMQPFQSDDTSQNPPYMGCYTFRRITIETVYVV